MGMQRCWKLVPNMEPYQESTKVLNLTVLRRIDPFVEEILITVAHATFYQFNLDIQQWSRKNVEGSLFVVKRNEQPRFQFIVMNRLNTDNLVEDILGDFEYTVQVPYLMYRNAAQEVIGMWFYNEDECEAVADLFSRILNAYSKVPAKPEVSTTKSSEFQEQEAVPTLAVMEDPLDRSLPSASPAPDFPADSFWNFFPAATNAGNTSNAAITGQQPHQTSATFPISSSTPNVFPSFLPSQKPAPPLPTLSTPLLPLLDTFESCSRSNRATNLVKPSFFAPPPSSSLITSLISSSTPTAPPLHPPVTMQCPNGTPLLQPFPSPMPPPSLTPTPNFAPVITRDKVRDALLRLVLNNKFIDMVYREMLNTYFP